LGGTSRAITNAQRTRLKDRNVITPNHSLLAVRLADLDAVTGGASAVRRPYSLLPGSGVTFSETRAEHACLLKSSKVKGTLTDREIGLKCGFSPERATAYSNAVYQAQDNIDP
jgi:hypothetical protein